MFDGSTDEVNRPHKVWSSKRPSVCLLNLCRCQSVSVITLFNSIIYINILTPNSSLTELLLK